MASLIAPENDYRAVSALPEQENIAATVVIPVYNRVKLLDNVLAGLSVQDTESSFEVIVVDDGSEDDVRAMVDRWVDSLDVRYLRQERSGRGAGRARNAGAAKASNDVLIFLDADCIPDPGFVVGHLSIQRRADNLVVSASRFHIDTEVSVEQVVSSFDSLAQASTRTDDQSGNTSSPDDWRRLFYRRTQMLRIGDEAYRAVLSGLMSVRRNRFEEVGGFDTTFRTWGGEDTELGWRLWNSGCFVIPLDEISVLHQRYMDSATGSEERAEARRRILPLVADRVPHRFYRKYNSARYTVPKVTWVISASSVEALEGTLERIGSDPVHDAEVIVVGSGDVTVQYDTLAQGADRVALVRSFDEAVHAANGELLCILADRASISRSLVERCVKLIDQPRSGIIRVGYKSGSTRWMSARSIHEADAEINGGVPMFAVVKRRDLMMDRSALGNPSALFRALYGRVRSHLLITDLVTIPSRASVPPSVPAVADLSSIGARELTRAVRRATKSVQKSTGNDDESSQPDSRPVISYVGFTGHDNLGDEAMLLAAKELMPWARVEPNAENGDLILLGGGTLLNADGYYLERVRRVDHPKSLRAVLGTGVRSFDYWNETEQLDSWRPFLDSCLIVGVRGPESLSSLRSWGWEGPGTVVGDLAFGLRDRPTEKVDSAVFCPMWTNGDLIGRSDLAVVQAFAETMRAVQAEGLDIVMLASHPSDDRAIVRITKELGSVDFLYVDGYSDIEGSIETIASARVVISERLHGSIIAAAMGTPFIAIEYQPKVKDFANSIDASQWCVRSDQLDELATITRRRLRLGPEPDEHVADMKFRLKSAAADIASSLGVSVVR